LKAVEEAVEAIGHEDDRPTQLARQGVGDLDFEAGRFLPFSSLKT